MEYTSEQLENAFKSAHPKIQEVLQDSWVSEKVAQIGQEYTLRIDRVDKLVRLVGLVLLNLLPLSSFVSELENELELDQNFANNLAKTLDKEVFEKVREIVKNNKRADYFKEQEIEKTRAEVEEIVDAIESGDIENMSFKDRLKKTIVKKEVEKEFDPYREPIE